MRRKLVMYLAMILAVLMMGSVFAVTVTLAVGAATGTANKTFDTSTPVFIHDLTTNALHSTFLSMRNMTVSMGDGYTTFKATTDDPYTDIKTPTCKPNEAKYVNIRYRTTAARKGELFCTRSDNSVMGSAGTNQQWDWNPSGEWETIVVSIDAWKNASDNVTFSIFRIDPLQGNVRAGESIDIQYYAYFSTEEDAKAFDFEEYKAMLAWEEEQRQEAENASKEVEWPTPTYVDMETTDEDTSEGTLKYEFSEDGSTVTISYEVNGNTLSYTVPNNENYLFGGYAGTDDLNRPLYDSSEVGSYDASQRTIGLFYFLWHGEHGDDGIFDLEKIINQVGVAAAGNISCGKYGPVGAMHWFAEPLYGYYYANDAWVLRKHAELLTLANIDFLFFDVTNAHPYLHNALLLMEYLHELNEQGFDAPQVVFYTNTDAHQTVRTIYENVYKANMYPDTWFMMDGKPVIVAPYDANIDNFFTIQQNQWPNDPQYKENGWPWMDFEWPQRVFKDENGNPNAINVSVAQHSGTVCFTHSSLYNNASNRGRSFSNPDNISSSQSRFDRLLRASYQAWREDPSLTNYGLNFQAQWENALASNAPLILVTGWNEWVAQRQPSNDGSVVFVDTASMEFSRDTEMMRGGYFDNYYMQLIYNVQRAKGTAPIVVQDSRKPINVTGEFDQWDDVTVTYRDAEGDTMDRDAMGFGHTSYTNTSGRNDIVSAKVTSDTKNLYFYIQTKHDVTMFDTNSSWMQIYLNVDRRDGDNGESGWYGYDYIVNYKAKDAFTTTLAKYNGADGAYGFTSVGEISYRAKDNEIMIAVPLSMLGIEGYKEISVEFKIADSDTVYDEMEDFYCDGDVAPLGRLNYVYQNYIPGVSQITYPNTEQGTQPETSPDVDHNTTPNSETTDSNTSGGCASVMSMAAVVTLICGIGCVVLCKKDD